MLRFCAIVAGITLVICLSHALSYQQAKEPCPRVKEQGTTKPRSQGFPMEIEDMAGRKVFLRKEPNRIICLAPGSLRLIVYLQREDRVVGVEDLEKQNPGGRPYWLAKPELAKLPRCGPGGPASINKKPDLEAVLSLAPDLVFVTYMDGSLADEVQKTLDIPVVVLSYGTFATFDERVYQALRLTGRILSRQARAQEVIDFIERQRKDLAQRSPRGARCYIGGLGFRGAHGIESSEKEYTPFDWVRAENVVKGEESSSRGSHVFIGKERLLQLDPDYIFIDGGGLALVEQDYREHRAYYESLSAFARDKVFVLFPYNWYTTNIGTALIDAYGIGKILHPKDFEDITIEEKADEIYSFLLGAPVHEDMVRDYGRLGRKLAPPSPR